MARPNLANGWQSTLTAGIDNDDTSASVASTTGTPDVPFVAVILPEGANAEEVVTVTAKSGSLTIVRGAEPNAAGSSTPSSHGAGAVIRHVLSVGTMDDFGDAIVAEASAGGSGYDLDTYTIDATYGDDFTAASLAGSWTASGFTGETFQVGKKQTYMRVPMSGRGRGDRYLRTAKSGDWTIACAFIPRFYVDQFPCFGLFVCDSSGNGVAATLYGSTPNSVIGDLISTYSSYGGHYVEPISASVDPNIGMFYAADVIESRKVWLALRKSGTSYYVSYSFDGEVWSPESAALTWTGTVDRFGFVIGPNGTIDKGLGRGSFIDLDWFNVIA